MYLKAAKLVTKAQRPSNIKCTIQEIFCTDEVKGAATLASASESETPTCAALSA